MSTDAYPGWQCEETAVGLRLERAGVVLWRGDCLEVLPLLGEVDAVVTDPPYGIARKNHGGLLESRGMILNDESQDVGNFVRNWADANRIALAMFASPRKPWPGEWRNLIVWDKGGAVSGGGDLTTCLKLSWELIQVARNGAIFGARDVSVWECIVTQKDFDNHPNEKPVPLLRRLMRTLFNNDEVILDPFMGSASTGVACIEMNKRFVGIELDPRFFDVAVQRITSALQAEKSSLFPAKTLATQPELF